MAIIGGGASGSAYTPPRTRSTRLGRSKAGKVARQGARRAPTRSQGGTGSRSYGGGTSFRGSSRSFGGGGGGGSGRSFGGGGGARRAAPRAPARPRYSGPPPPTAAMIAQLAAQIGDIGRRYGEAGATYRSGVGQAQAGRKAFLQQLGDFYTQQQNQTAADFQSRGLLQSGLYNEALANLGKQRAAQQGQYESQYRGGLADLLRTLTTTRSGLSQQKATLSDRYNQQRADRARILRLMGG